ncbi:AP-1 complex subunit gamma [Tritrichomonas foetus]|uniref:AP-1 complex subunit gamma n=1 Tax=Tritrichomonas foetus TaxID=1144522 RepID=A0A1J4JVQ8_9EUKA|nr:AP-1 complex subunit gamma [Tritrichomonas foetus]|eukprot:OHT01365.1 AP-1 complex subunit gamma [Tritrichomonas foetus]
MKSTYDEFVHSVEDATTIDKKNEIKGHELAKIRNRVKIENDQPGRPRVVAKLIYLEMEGENTAFGQIEVASLMANSRFSYKWIGYVGAGVLTDANCDVVLLMTQTIINDIQNTKDFRCQCLGLSAVANIGGSDLITAAIPEIQKAIDGRNPHVIKCAAMAALRCIRLNNEYYENFRKCVPKLLNHADHCVMLAGINLAVEMLKTVPTLPKQWENFTRPFIDLLRDLKTNPPTKETEFHLFNDPFLQCQALKALGLIHKKSDELDSLLQEIITDLDCHTNTGRSILIEATETIARAGKNPSLKTLAINQIGRLLGLKSAAVNYSALSAFSRLLHSDNDMINRSSSDSTAMQRYRSQIVKCLEHPDLSIRRRALDVISAIINEQNIVKLVPEIMKYMKLVDTEFRAEIVPKLFASVHRFSPDPRWTIDTIIHIVIDNASFIGNDIITSFCSLVTNNVNLRFVALEQLESVIGNYGTNQPLVQIAAFSIGEFETRNPSIIPTLLQTIVLPKQLGRTTCYILSALGKLAIRFNCAEEVMPCLQKFACDNRLDVQQRAGEMMRILSSENAVDILVPMSDETDELSQQQQQQNQDYQPKNQRLTQPKRQENVDTLLNIMDEPPTRQKGGSNNRQSDSLLDLMDGPQIPSLPANAVLAFEQSDFVTYFEVQRNDRDPRQVAIRASFYNKTKVQLNNFQATFGVPDGWSLTPQRPSGTNLAPQGGQPIQQVLLLMNRGKSPLAMRAQVSYLFRSQPITEKCQVNSIF